MTVLLSCLSLAFGVGKEKKKGPHKMYIPLHVQEELLNYFCEVSAL